MVEALTKDFQATGRSKKEVNLSFQAETKDVAAGLSGEKGRGNLDVLSRELGVKINLSGMRFAITGPKENAEAATNLMKVLAPTVQPGFVLTSEIIKDALANPANQNADANKDYIILPDGTRVDPRNDRQRQQIIGFRNSDTVFMTGEAGTGKTWISVMLAVEALESGLYPGGIVLVRPAVGAGEELGYMPGDLQAKVDGYMRPLYDALEEVYGDKGVESKMRSKIIEIAAVAFMRGRDIKDAIIILDESQNMTEEQLKMLLTRVGKGSKILLAGDVTQTDLPKGVTSGLADIVARLKHPEAKEKGYLKDTALVEYLPGDSVRSAAATRALGLYAIDLNPPGLFKSIWNKIAGITSPKASVTVTKPEQTPAPVVSADDKKPEQTPTVPPTSNGPSL